MKRTASLTVILAAAYFTMAFPSALRADSRPAAVRPAGVYELPTIVMEAGQSRELPLALFLPGYTPGKKITARFFCGRALAASLDEKKSAVVLSAAPSSRGAVESARMTFSDGPRVFECSVVARISAPQVSTLTYKPPSPASSVSAAGDFNSWNASATPMKGPDESGVYSVKLKLAPGEYNYKFVVDGKWLPDPDNPDRNPDGFGGYNSVLSAGQRIKSGVWRTVLLTTHCATVVYVPEENVPQIDTATLKITTGGRLLSPSEFSFDAQSGNLTLKIPEPARTADVRINAATVAGPAAPEFVVKFPSADRWDGRLIYFAFTDRFLNGDESNDDPSRDPAVEPAANYAGGDFAGLTEKIRDGYFRRLGVGVIWISPFILNPVEAYRDALPPHKKFTGYHGYWPVSFDVVDPRFGTLDELKTLVAEAHARGIKVIFDMVLNHAHEENALYKERRGWFSDIKLPDGRKNIRLFDERPLDTWFDDFLPDFDYAKNPAAVEYMVRNCVEWIKKTDCDGFRLDAVKHLPVEFWLSLRRAVRSEIEIPRGRKFYMVGESISSREKIMEYVGWDRLDGQFDFPLYWAIKDVFAWETKGLDYLESERKKSEIQYGDSLPSALMGNHDFARFAAFADGAVPPGADEKARSWQNRPEIKNAAAYAKIRMATSFLLTQPGLPMIYYGDEIAMCGAGDPDNRRQMKFETLTRRERETLDYVSKIAAFRSTSNALKLGEYHTLFAGAEAYGYLRNYFGETVIVVINRSGKTLKMSLALPAGLAGNKTYEDIITGKKTDISKLGVPPRTAVILRGIRT